MSWLLLSVLSAIILGVYEVAKKAALHRNAVLPVLLTSSCIGALLVLPAGAISLASPETAMRLGIYVAPLDASGHALVLAKAAIVTLSWVLTFFALKHLPISLASPIRASAPLFVLLGAVAVFGERPSFAQWIGIAVIVLSYLAFSTLGRAEGIVFGRNRWVWMVFAGTVVGAASGLYDKHLLQSAHLPPGSVQFYFTIYNMMLQAVIVLLLWMPRRHGTTPFQWRWAIASVSVLLLVADYLYFRALAEPSALISLVSVIRRGNVVVSFTVGAIAFGELNRGRKAMALAGVLVGVALLVR